MAGSLRVLGSQVPSEPVVVLIRRAFFGQQIKSSRRFHDVVDAFSYLRLPHSGHHIAQQPSNQESDSASSCWHSAL